MKHFGVTLVSIKFAIKTDRNLLNESTETKNVKVSLNYYLDIIKTNLFHIQK